MGSVLSKNGAPGSGNWGHQGRKGKIGGSMPSKGNKALSDWQKDRQRVGKEYAKATAIMKETNFDEWKKLHYGGIKKADGHWVATIPEDSVVKLRHSILERIKGGTEKNPERYEKDTDKEQEQDKKKQLIKKLDKKQKETPKKKTKKISVENELEQCKQNSINKSLQMMTDIFRKYKKSF